MFITVTSDMIRQLAYKNLEVPVMELKDMSKEYYQKILL